MKMWKVCCFKYPQQEIIFCSQVILIYIVVVACLINLSFSRNYECMWSALSEWKFGLPAAFAQTDKEK